MPVRRKVLWASVWCALGLVTALKLLGAEGEHAEESAMTMSDWLQHYVKTSGWALLCFAVVLFILYKKLFPPIVKALDRRAAMIQESLDSAKEAKAEAEKMIAEHQVSLEKARSESRAIIEEAKEDATRVKNGIIADARRESEEITARSKRELELAKQAAVDELYRQSARLSFDLAEKVIQKSLSPKDHQQLIDKTIESYRKET